MRIYSYQFTILDSNMYILLQKQSALIIDPCVNEDALLLLHRERVQEITIILTHEHYDHISGVNWWKEKFTCDVLCSDICANNIQNARKNMSKYFNIFLSLNRKTLDSQDEVKPYECMATKWFEDEYEFLWEGHNVLLKKTPGHTDGSIIILIDSRYLFAGDSLLRN